MLKTLCENDWVSLLDLNGYVYSHETRCNGVIVAILPYRRNEKGRLQFLLRREITPCWSMEFEDSAITGGLEKNDSIFTVLKELHEEAGYKAEQNELKILGKCRASKSTDTEYHLYAINVQNKEQGALEGDELDDDAINKDASVVWSDDADSVDPLVSVMYVRLMRILGEEL